jgi:hypothetical protein
MRQMGNQTIPELPEAERPELSSSSDIDSDPTSQDNLAALVQELSDTDEARVIGVFRRIGDSVVSATRRTGEFIPKPDIGRTAKTLGVVTVAALGVGALHPATADGQLAKIKAKNGMLNVRTPDPNVMQMPGNPNSLVLTGTTDYGQENFEPGNNGSITGYGQSPNAISILASTDGGNDWKFKNFLFRNGSHPTQAMAPTGNWPGPRYWAPDERYNSTTGMYDFYFATGINAGTAKWIEKHYGVGAQAGEMAIFAAWSKSPYAYGQVASKLLLFRGEFNNVAGNVKQSFGGLIDPTVAEIPQQGSNPAQLVLGVTEQPNQTYITRLNPDGVSITNKQWRRISYSNYPWEHGVEEGGVLSWNTQAGVLQEELNTASTWGTDGNYYRVKYIASADPFHRAWMSYDQPILQSGSNEFDPGLGSEPITLPNGETKIFVHVLPKSEKRDSASQDRVLDVLNYNPNGSEKLYLPAGTSNPTANVSNTSVFYKVNNQYISAAEYVQLAQTASVPIKSEVRQFDQVSVPEIGNNGKA